METDLKSRIRPVQRAADEAWVLAVFKANQSILGPGSVAWFRYWAAPHARNRWLVLPELAFVHYRKRLDGVNVIDEIAVDASAKRQGLGRLLVDAVGLPCELKTDSNNEESNRFYERLGFYPAGLKRSRNGKKTFRIWRKG